MRRAPTPNKGVFEGEDRASRHDTIDEPQRNSHRRRATSDGDEAAKRRRSGGEAAAKRRRSDGGATRKRVSYPPSHRLR